MQALETGNHLIDGKSIEAKQATRQKRIEKPKPKKVFVGGIPNDITEEEMKDHFIKFGEVSLGPDTLYKQSIEI